MKKLMALIIAIATIVGFNTANAQQKANPIAIGWNEMEEFHKVMSQTFHPAEEGKLEPIRTRSQEMADKASAWKKSTAPEGYNKKAVKSSLKKLVKGANEINRLVKENAADNVIREKLTALHNVFHEIMEKCGKEDHM